MFFFGNKYDRSSRKNASLHREYTDSQATLDAIKASMAAIEFQPNGNIITANAPFLETVGYSLAEIEGKHHRIFCPQSIVDSADYKHFWQDLSAGRFLSGEFKRIRKDGSTLWLEASYSPVRDIDGNVVKIIKLAADVTEKLRHLKDAQSLQTALTRSVAVIEFTPDGTVITANDNFCHATGYRLEQIQGKHHRMFCPPDYANSSEYASFWTRLANGEVFGGRSERVDASGKELWLEATYNPIRDENDKVYKVVKCATNITAEVLQDKQNASSAIKAHRLATETDSTVEKGSEVIHKAVQEMSNISTVVSESAATIEELANHSAQITDIVDTIRGIAEQTNLLALNAAIEAARAGDQGRGFAVVADEVRQLAGRTSVSTQEISTMIEKIHSLTGSAIGSMNTCQSQAAAGVELSGQAGEVITQMKNRLSEVVSAVSAFSGRLEKNDTLRAID
ncbi:MAG: PAS domain-containing methyl-accepting chemotaxis protein [Pseudomonadota bacterium]